jgi:hypothetical protein
MSFDSCSEIVVIMQPAPKGEGAAESLKNMGAAHAA